LGKSGWEINEVKFMAETILENTTEIPKDYQKMWKNGGSAKCSAIIKINIRLYFWSTSKCPNSP
jgi:hypothetical protein